MDIEISFTPNTHNRHHHLSSHQPQTSHNGLSLRKLNLDSSRQQGGGRGLACVRSVSTISTTLYIYYFISTVYIYYYISIIYLLLYIYYSISTVYIYCISTTVYLLSLETQWRPHRSRYPHSPVPSGSAAAPRSTLSQSTVTQPPEAD